MMIGQDLVDFRSVRLILVSKDALAFCRLMLDFDKLNIEGLYWEPNIIDVAWSLKISVLELKI